MPVPAWSGVISSVISWPYSGIPASSRSTSRAPKPAGSSPRSRFSASSRSHTPRRFFRRQEHLEAVFARVACARDDDRLAQAFDARLCGRVVFHRCELGFDVRLQPFHGARPLDRDERALAVEVLRLHVAGEVAADVRPHLVGVAGVDDQQPAVLVEPVKDHVVVRTAVLVGEDVVARLTGLHVRDLVDGQRLGPCAHVRAAQVELRHVREVEQARSLAHGLVLLEDARILHGHLEPAKRHDPRTQRQVSIVERGAAKRAVDLGGHVHSRCSNRIASPSRSPKRVLCKGCQIKLPKRYPHESGSCSEMLSAYALSIMFATTTHVTSPAPHPHTVKSSHPSSHKKPKRPPTSAPTPTPSPGAISPPGTPPPYKPGSPPRVVSGLVR